MGDYTPIERKNYSIYKWIHTSQELENFIYVGNTSNITKRKSQHKKCCNNINNKAYNLELYKKMREYGFDNFKMVVLATAENITKREAEKLEEEYRVAEKANLNMNRCYTSDEQKKQEKAEYSKQYRQENKEYLTQYDKQYYQHNKQEINEYDKQYYQNNIEQIKEQKQQYRQNNKAELNEKANKYYANNKEKIAEQRKKNYQKNKTKLETQTQEPI